MKKAIVTGAGGFLGSALTAGLADTGARVFAVYREDREIPAALPQTVVPVVCNLKDAAGLPLLIPDRDIDCLYHFAWQGSAGPSRADADVQLANVSISLNVLSAAAVMGCARFVYASSIMEYELEKTLEAGEVPPPQHVYSAAKLAARQMGGMIAKEKGVAFIPVIISNIFGEGEISPRLINTTVRKLLKGEPLACTAGLQIYDFLYIRDAVGAFIAVGEKGVPFKSYYLGSPSPRPLRDFLTELRDCVAPAAELGLGKLPFTGVSLDLRALFDIDAIKNDTGFVPRYTFAEGIRKTAQWISGREDIYGEF